MIGQNTIFFQLTEDMKEVVMILERKVGRSRIRVEGKQIAKCCHTFRRKGRD